MHLEEGEVPANNLFANAAVVAGTKITVTANNAFASVERGEPTHFEDETGKTLWWKWIAPEDGELTLSTGMQNGGFESALYKEESLTNLVRGRL